MCCIGVVLEIARLDFDHRSRPIVKMRKKPMLDNFFQGYRRVDLAASELIVSVFIPLPRTSNFHIFGFKQSRRREDDIAIVNAGMSVLFEETPYTGEKCAKTAPMVKKLIVSYGGMAAMTIALEEYMSFWNGKPWNLSTLVQSVPILQKLTELAANTPGGQVKYRSRLARNFFFKFFFQVAYEAELTMDEMNRSLSSGPIDCDLLKPILNEAILKLGPALYPVLPHPTYKYHKEPTKGLQVSRQVSLSILSL